MRVVRRSRGSSRGAKTVAGRTILTQLKAVGKRQKFGAQPTVFDGVKYPSKWEATVAKELDELLRAGLILRVERQVPYLLTDNPKGPKVILDFKVTRLDGSYYILEAKGVRTAVWKLKERLFRERYPYEELIVRFRKAAAPRKRPRRAA